MSGGDFLVPLSSPDAAAASRVGPKAANLAALARAGLPTPGGACVTADAYRAQLAGLDLEALAHDVFTAEDAQARRSALKLRMRLMEAPVAPAIQEPLLAAWRKVTRNGDLPGVVRSSALVEDRHGSSFAGQFESFLSLDNVVLQPHHASGTVETRQAMGRLVRDNLAAHFADQPLLTPVI